MVISITPLLCSCCDSAYHRSCSELTKDAATAALHGGSWICNRCAVVPPSRPNIAAQPRTEVSEPPCRTSKHMLRILQWNADGLSTKVQELRDRLAAQSINVCLIQETKLAEKDASPPFSCTTQSDLTNAKPAETPNHDQCQTSMQPLCDETTSATENHTE